MIIEHTPSTDTKAKELLNEWLKSISEIITKYNLDNDTFVPMLTFSLCIFISHVAYSFFPQEHREMGFPLIDDISKMAKDMLKDRINKTIN